MCCTDLQWLPAAGQRIQHRTDKGNKLHASYKTKILALGDAAALETTPRTVPVGEQKNTPAQGCKALPETLTAVALPCAHSVTQYNYLCQRAKLPKHTHTATDQPSCPNCSLCQTQVTQATNSPCGTAQPRCRASAAPRCHARPTPKCPSKADKTVSAWTPEPK